MKRTVMAVLLMAGAGLAALQSGCKSIEDYNNLMAAYQSCEGERTEQRQRIAVLEAQLSAVTAERDQLRASGPAVERTLRDRITQLDAEILKLREALAAASAQAPVVNIGHVALPKPMHEALQRLAREYPGLEYDEKLGLVRFSSDLLFDLGSWNLKADVAKQMADFSRIINMPEAREYDVLVVGHTDGVPVTRAETRQVTPSNWHLSVYRAVSVVQALQKERVDASRLSAMGFGQERPRPGTTNAATKPPGTPANRRVEVFIVPKKSLAGASADAGFVIRGQEIASFSE